MSYCERCESISQLLVKEKIKNKKSELMDNEFFYRVYRREYYVKANAKLESEIKELEAQLQEFLY